MLAVMLVVRVVGVLTNIPRLSQANYSLLAPAWAGLARALAQRCEGRELGGGRRRRGHQCVITRYYLVTDNVVM